MCAVKWNFLELDRDKGTQICRKSHRWGKNEAELPGVEALWWSSGASNKYLRKITGCN